MSSPVIPAPIKFKKAIAEKANLNNRIDSTGAYIGALTRAKYTTFPSGAAGYLLSFKSSSGQEAGNMFVCTVNTSGEENAIGVAQLHAIMCVTAVPQITHVVNEVMEYDYDERKDVARKAVVAPELVNVPIGLVLQKELTTNRDTGRDGFRMSLQAAFHAPTRRTAKEMIDGSDPESIDAMLLSLKDKDSRTGNTASSRSSVQSTNKGNVLEGDDGMDDDIPF